MGLRPGFGFGVGVPFCFFDLDPQPQDHYTSRSIKTTRSRLNASATCNLRLSASNSAGTMIRSNGLYSGYVSKKDFVSFGIAFLSSSCDLSDSVVALELYPAMKPRYISRSGIKPAVRSG